MTRAGTPAALRAAVPAKAILFGEHAVNRGQAGIAVSLGLFAECTVRPLASDRIRLRAGSLTDETSAAAIRARAAEVDARRAALDFAALADLAARDFFAPCR